MFLSFFILLLLLCYERTVYCVNVCLSLFWQRLFSVCSIRLLFFHLSFAYLLYVAAVTWCRYGCCCCCCYSREQYSNAWVCANQIKKHVTKDSLLLCNMRWNVCNLTWKGIARKRREAASKCSSPLMMIIVCKIYAIHIHKHTNIFIPDAAYNGLSDC